MVEDRTFRRLETGAGVGSLFALCGGRGGGLWPPIACMSVRPSTMRQPLCEIERASGRVQVFHRDNAGQRLGGMESGLLGL